MTTSVPPMSDPTLPQQPALSQVERIVDTFVAPSKTFADIRRSAAWWMPFLIGCILSYGFMFGVQTKVGWPQVVENALRATPKQAEKMEQSTPEQQQKIRGVMAMSYRIGFLAWPLLALLFGAIITGIFMMTVNFASAARANSRNTSPSGSMPVCRWRSPRCSSSFSCLLEAEARIFAWTIPSARIRDFTLLPAQSRPGWRHCSPRWTSLPSGLWCCFPLAIR